MNEKLSANQEDIQMKKKLMPVIITLLLASACQADIITVDDDGPADHNYGDDSDWVLLYIKVPSAGDREDPHNLGISGKLRARKKWTGIVSKKRPSETANVSRHTTKLNFTITNENVYDKA
jgi:hypothetical protein